LFSNLQKPSILLTKFIVLITFFKTQRAKINILIKNHIFQKPSISSFSENPEMKIKNAQLGQGKERFFIAVSSTNPKKS